jgi:hypothetical protein
MSLETGTRRNQPNPKSRAPGRPNQPRGTRRSGWATIQDVGRAVIPIA